MLRSLLGSEMCIRYSQESVGAVRSSPQIVSEARRMSADAHQILDNIRRSSGPPLKFEDFDRNKDGVITREEFVSVVKSAHRQVVADGDQPGQGWQPDRVMTENEVEAAIQNQLKDVEAQLRFTRKFKRSTESAAPESPQMNQDQSPEPVTWL
eukprot:TRINITY_DN59088_c0_g1_i1.p2 TRINITY_DN59088_c0_g1~~TRINITY_DN59088_c0_g1_i1.p2  ORF type:complete len:153 (-),score=27.65 TRINITY_DN59088_c0_g1_i1:3-461(-)